MTAAVAKAPARPMTPDEITQIRVKLMALTQRVDALEGHIESRITARDVNWGTLPQTDPGLFADSVRDVFGLGAS